MLLSSSTAPDLVMALRASRGLYWGSSAEPNWEEDLSIFLVFKLVELCCLI